MQHASLVDRYSKLIPTIKYRKEIDEFATPECVICMEPFGTGVRVRKVPSCRHILHDDCLMKWLGGSQQQESQKCPMCNSDITIEILEKAIEESNSAKKGGILGGIFGSPAKVSAKVSREPNNSRQPRSRPHRSSNPSQS